MEKITKREMFEALVAYAESTDMEVQVGETTVTAADFAAFATKEVEQLDKKAVKAKERADEDATVAKVSYRLGALVKDGKAAKEDIKVDREGKRAVLKGYRLV